MRGEGDEFDALAEAINAMLDRLEQLMQATRTAGDAIAHDLRSPLTRFRQRLETALEAPPESDADREALRKAVEEADRLLEMFAGVLQARARRSQRQLAARSASTRPRSCAIWANSIEPAAEEQGLAFTSAVEADLVLNGEAALFAQAVSNLIENAHEIHASRRAREVQRARLRPDGRVEINVSDDGPGIAPSDRDRVLERFVRLESARSSPGAGLGAQPGGGGGAAAPWRAAFARWLAPTVTGRGLGAALVLPA